MDRDPWYFQRWAFGLKTGGPAPKALMNALAMMADMATGRCEAKVRTLAEGCEMGERTVRTHLAKLEADGYIARRAQYKRDGSRRGDEFLLLAPGITEWPDGDPLPNPQGGPAGNDPTPSPLSGEAPSPSVAAQEHPPVTTASGTATVEHPPAAAGGQGALVPAEPASDPVAEVHACWQRLIPAHANMGLTKGRRDLIARRLKTFTAAQLCQALEVIAVDPWLNGQNPRGKRYTDFSTVFRSDEKVEGYLLEFQERAAGTAPQPVNDGHMSSAERDSAAVNANIMGALRRLREDGGQG